METDDNTVEIAKQLGVIISRSDISISHTRSPPSKTYLNPIIVANFVNQKLTDDICGKILKLKIINGRTPAGRSKLFINESLTKQNKEIFKAAPAFQNKYKYRYVWTRNGITYLKKVMTANLSLSEGFKTCQKKLVGQCDITNKVIS